MLIYELGAHDSNNNHGKVNRQSFKKLNHEITAKSLYIGLKKNLRRILWEY